MSSATKQQYRSRLEILGDILNTTAYEGQNGVNLSTISRKANLSHYIAIEKCDRLVQAGLIESKVTSKSKIFTITDKGMHFFYEFRKFQDLMNQLNLT